MFGNAVLKAHVTMENLVIGNVTTVTTRLMSILVTGANFVAGDGVLVTCRDATGFTARLSFYGVVVDATHIGLCVANASAADVDPADTFDWDIYVFAATGNAKVGA